MALTAECRSNCGTVLPMEEALPGSLPVPLIPGKGCFI
jgi:hypothetical protein